MKRLSVALMAALVIALAVTATAFAVTDPPADDTGCPLCHAPGTPGAWAKVDFAATSTVDYARCRTCHAALPDLVLYAGTLVPVHYHTQFMWCGNCHNEVDGFGFTVPAEASDVDALVSTPYGFFLDASSPSADAATLHAAHDGGGWVQEQLGDENPECSGCHAAAACTACHAGPVHTDHGGLTCSAAGCHALSVTSAPDPSPSCVACHGSHGVMSEVHDASASTECVGCHESSDIRYVHGVSVEDSCAICHPLEGQTAACASCHAELAPTYPNHYPSAAHFASAEPGCRCHSKDLYTEHSKYAVGCVACHEGYVDAFTAPWNFTCAACHPTKHGAAGTSPGGGGSGRR